MAEANLKGVIEAILFSSNRPILLNDLREVFGNLEASAIRQILEDLKNEYQEGRRGLSIVEVAGGFQMVTSSEYAEFLKKFYRQHHTEKLSVPALETLSIVAYKQPITKLDIEGIRGVNADGVVRNLLDKKLVKMVGRKDVVGRPFLYGTTKQFLEYFGLQSLEELPHLEEFENLQNSLPGNKEEGNEPKILTTEDR